MDDDCKNKDTNEYNKKLNKLSECHYDIKHNGSCTLFLSRLQDMSRTMFNCSAGSRTMFNCSAGSRTMSNSFVESRKIECKKDFDDQDHGLLFRKIWFKKYKSRAMPKSMCSRSGNFDSEIPKIDNEGMNESGLRMRVHLGFHRLDLDDENDNSGNNKNKEHEDICEGEIISIDDELITIQGADGYIYDLHESFIVSFE